MSDTGTATDTTSWAIAQLTDVARRAWWEHDVNPTVLAVWRDLGAVEVDRHGRGCLTETGIGLVEKREARPAEAVETQRTEETT